MTIIVCSEICDICDENFLKDPRCLGDYSEEGILLKFCGVCGQMVPYLSVEIGFEENITISNNRKKKGAKRLAKLNGLDYKKMNEVVRDLRAIDNKVDYATQLSSKVNEMFDIETDKDEIIEML